MKDMIVNEIRKGAERVYPVVLRDRRFLHANPELSFSEYETSAYIKFRLDEIGIPWKAMAGTGVVGLIEGDKPSDRVVALRADMDALPIREANVLDYASKRDGVMHACGHDAHTASLLGAAVILQSLKRRFGGTIKLIFQPGEEVLPGGAGMMLKEGVLDLPRPAAVIGQHVSPALGCGKVGFRPGKFMASMDSLYVTVTGRGGHGAQPQMNIDPVLITAQIIVALQQVVSRMTDPTLPTVLSFGKVVADGSVNVIPDLVYMEGTFRTLDEGWRAEAHRRMSAMAVAIAESMGGSCDFRIVRGYPFLVNEAQLTARAAQCAADYLGKEHVVDLDIWMAAEDFAYYAQVTDSCFYLLGTGNPTKGIISSLHTPTFQIDEDALVHSTGLMAYIALKELGN